MDGDSSPRSSSSSLLGRTSGEARWACLSAVAAPWGGGVLFYFQVRGGSVFPVPRKPPDQGYMSAIHLWSTDARGERLKPSAVKCLPWGDTLTKSRMGGQEPLAGTQNRDSFHTPSRNLTILTLPIQPPSLNKPSSVMSPSTQAWCPRPTGGRVLS